MACSNEPSVWLVTGARPGPAPGRVLVYCDDCRRDKADALAVAIPLDVLDVDPEGIVLALYTAGHTRSDPSIVAEGLEFPAAWVAKADAAVASRR